MDDASDFDLACDVAVVGGGMAGLSAAVTAASQGRTVVLFERESFLGGTTALSGGAAWVPNNPLMRANGIFDDKQSALRYMARLAYPSRYDPDSEFLGLLPAHYALLEVFYDRGPEAVDHLTKIGAVSYHFSSRITDYHPDLPEDEHPVGRRMPHKGRGQGVIDRLQRAGRKLGVDIRTGSRVTEFIRSDEPDAGVSGVVVQEGRRVRLARATAGVIFATGGFSHNTELVTRHLPGRVFGSCAAPGAQGDFVRMARLAGADFDGMANGWWKQVPVEAALRDGFIEGYFGFGARSLIQVNKYGRRVVNEKLPYNERGKIHAQWDPTRLEYPNLVTFLIWDGKSQEDPWSSPATVIANEHDLLSAPTVAELADALSQRLAVLESEIGRIRLDESFLTTLQAEIRGFNAAAATGSDPRFRRGESLIDRVAPWIAPGDYPHLANPSMEAFDDHGPYYAVILGAGLLDTNGGPRIDSAARVLDGAGQPIPGLYAAGNCAASVAGAAYWGAGSTLGPALCFGYIAGMSCAAKTPVGACVRYGSVMNGREGTPEAIERN